MIDAGIGANSASGGYNIDNSLKLEADNTEYLSRNPSTDTNRQTWTFSTWVKRAELGQNARLIDVYSNGANFTTFGFDLSDRIVLYSINGGVDYGGHYTQRFRDTSAWYHIIWKSDTTNATAANRFQIYVNGVEVTVKDIDYGTPPQNFNSLMNTTLSTKIGYNTDGSNGSSQYMAETHLIDGQALEPTEFGEFDEDSGIWKPKAYEGTYGTNGFYLEYKLPNALGADTVVGGNSNDFTTNNITAADQATDTPTNNFCTLNPLHMYSGTSSYNPIVSDGATKFTTVRVGYWATVIANIGLTSGKWYFEAQPGTSNSHITDIGYGDESDINDWAQDQADTSGFPGETGTNSIGYLGSDTETTYGNVWLGTGSRSGAANSANYTISNIVGVAIDADNGFVYFAKDNTYINSGNPGSGASGTGGDTFEDTTTPRTGTVFPAVGGYYHNAACVINVNFGGYTAISISSGATDANGYGTFEYAPPSGYYAICTKNLAEFG
jgi:hypothetical protein